MMPTRYLDGITNMRLFSVLASLLFCATAAATTVMMERGPEPVVHVARDRNLYDIYVTAPPRAPNYEPGTLSIHLSRDGYPDFMRVPLAFDRLSDGKLHTRINIAPEMEPAYSVYVYDQQPGGKMLLLLSKALRELK